MKKSISITSLSPEDRKDLFSAICSRIAFKSELEVIRQVLKIPAHHRVVKNFQPTISDLFLVIEAYQIPYEFGLKLTYFEREKEIKKPVTEMEKQKQEITNPALVTKHRVIQFKDVERKTIHPSQIPEIDLGDF